MLELETVSDGEEKPNPLSPHEIKVTRMSMLSNFGAMVLALGGIGHGPVRPQELNGAATV
jgi:hypothetical protein